MSIRRYRVESLDFVKDQYEKWGKDKFVKHYVKGDAFIGNSEAIDFIDGVLKENIEGWLVVGDDED